MLVDREHTPTTAIQDGFYLVVLDNKQFIFRVQNQRLAKVRTFGSRTLYDLGPIESPMPERVRWTSEEITRQNYNAANALLTGDTEAAGKMYARAFGRCYVCNRELSDPHSLATGIGPDCAGTRRHTEVTLF